MNKQDRMVISCAVTVMMGFSALIFAQEWNQLSQVMRSYALSHMLLYLSSLCFSVHLISDYLQSRSKK